MFQMNFDLNISSSQSQNSKGHSSSEEHARLTSSGTPDSELSLRCFPSQGSHSMTHLDQDYTLDEEQFSKLYYPVDSSFAQNIISDSTNSPHGYRLDLCDAFLTSSNLPFNNEQTTAPDQTQVIPRAPSNSTNLVLGGGGGACESYFGSQKQTSLGALKNQSVTTQSGEHHHPSLQL